MGFDFDGVLSSLLFAVISFVSCRMIRKHFDGLENKLGVYFKVDDEFGTQRLVYYMVALLIFVLLVTFASALMVKLVGDTRYGVALLGGVVVGLFYLNLKLFFKSYYKG